MNAEQGSSMVQTVDWDSDLEGDLATVSCYAATDLDNIIRDRPRGIAAVRKLVELIRTSMPSVAESLSPSYLVDPVAVVAVNRALVFVNPYLQDKLNTLRPLVQEAEKVATFLDKLSADPEGFRRTQLPELERMRSFCLALSRSALSFEPNPDNPHYGLPAG